MKQELKPFADDETVLTVGALTVENGTGSISVHGDVEIRRDRPGLEAAEALAKLFTDIAQDLRKDPLPDAAPAEGDGGDVVTNPFG
jgi:hypothetical protein